MKRKIDMTKNVGYIPLRYQYSILKRMGLDNNGIREQFGKLLIKWGEYKIRTVHKRKSNSISTSIDNKRNPFIENRGINRSMNEIKRVKKLLGLNNFNDYKIAAPTTGNILENPNGFNDPIDGSGGNILEKPFNDPIDGSGGNILERGLNSRRSFRNATKGVFLERSNGYRRILERSNARNGPYLGDICERSWNARNGPYLGDICERSWNSRPGAGVFLEKANSARPGAGVFLEKANRINGFGRHYSSIQARPKLRRFNDDSTTSTTSTASTTSTHFGPTDSKAGHTLEHSPIQTIQTISKIQFLENSYNSMYKQLTMDEYRTLIKRAKYDSKKISVKHELRQLKENKRNDTALPIEDGTEIDYTIPPNEGKRDVLMIAPTIKKMANPIENEKISHFFNSRCYH